jgi:hypothetical protein
MPSRGSKLTKKTIKFSLKIYLKILKDKTKYVFFCEILDFLSLLEIFGVFGKNSYVGRRINT